MLTIKQVMQLYAVTDSRWLNGRRLVDCVAQALAGGVTMVQLREKTLDQAAFIAEGKAIAALCRQARVPFVIDDNLAVAKAVDADGIHVGQTDMPLAAVKASWGPDKIIGVSAETLAQAKAAAAGGADYLGVGAVFPTQTKLDAETVSLATLQAITSAVDIPVCAIGGIELANIPALYPSGIDGVALVSAIFAAPDITAAAQALKTQTAPFQA